MTTTASTITIVKTFPLGITAYSDSTKHSLEIVNISGTNNIVNNPGITGDGTIAPLVVTYNNVPVTDGINKITLIYSTNADLDVNTTFDIVGRLSVRKIVSKDTYNI